MVCQRRPTGSGIWCVRGGPLDQGYGVSEEAHWIRIWCVRGGPLDQGYGVSEEAHWIRDMVCQRRPTGSGYGVSEEAHWIRDMVCQRRPTGSGIWCVRGGPLDQDMVPVDSSSLYVDLKTS